MSLLPQDETGKAEHGYSYDFGMPEVAVYIDNGAGGVKLWDGEIDAILTGDLYVALDDVEALLTSIKTAVEILDNFISGSRGLVTEDNSAAILSELQSQSGGASWEDIRYDYAGSKLIYTGMNATHKEPTANATWSIWKYTYTGNTLIREEGPLIGSWDGRAALAWG